MKPLSRLLPPENILLDFQATSKKRVFEHIGLLFENNQGIGQRIVFDSLLARERLGSTGLGQGIAIPHGRIEGLKAPQGAFIRLASPVPFESPDGLPVSMLFALLVPEQAAEQHLQILAELAAVFSERAHREALQTATTVEDVRQVFTHSAGMA